MGVYLLPDNELALLKAKSFRLKAYIGFVPAYTPTCQSLKRDGLEIREEIVWKPMVQFGPNRLAVVGETLTFYAGNCYNRDGGGVKNQYKSFDWGDGSPDTQLSGTATGGAGATATHAYAAAGCYAVTLTCADDGTHGTNQGTRYVRVYNSWAEAYQGSVKIGSLTGSYSKGGCSLPVQIDGYVGPPVGMGAISDKQGVVVRLQQIWNFDDFAHTQDDTQVGEGAEAVSTYFAGYVVGDSVAWDKDLHRITFDVATPDQFLNNLMVYAQDFFNKARDGWGHIIQDLRFSDVIQHLLVMHTNFATYHDVCLWVQDWPTGNVLDNCTIGEGSVWQGLQDFAKNEFGFAYCNRQSTLFMVPNVNIRGFGWWGSYSQPPFLCFDKDNTATIEVTEGPDDKVGYVQIEATNEFTKKALTAKYPGFPGPSGAWYIEREIKCQDQAQLDSFAKHMFYKLNARYSVKITCPVYMPMGPGDMVVLDYVDPQGRINFSETVGGGEFKKPFYITDISQDIDHEAGKCLTTYQLEEMPNTRYNTLLYRWEWLEDGVWKAGPPCGTPPPTGLPPVSTFTYLIERLHTFELGLIYIAYCDATSTNKDGPTSDLTYAWSNDKNADVGTDTHYVTWFSEAEWAANPQVTLVTSNQNNPDSETATLTALTEYTVIKGDWLIKIATKFNTTWQVLVQLNKDRYPSIESNPDLIYPGWVLRLPGLVTTELFVAAGKYLEAYDGSTWRQWDCGTALGSYSYVTPRYPPKGKGIWGIGSDLYVSTNYLATPPTKVHTFPDSVTAIWVYYSDQNEWWVGLYNGMLYRTTNANAGAGAIWTRVCWFNNPLNYQINDIHRGWDGLLRVCWKESEFLTSSLAPRAYSNPMPTMTNMAGYAYKMAIGDAMVRGSEYAPDHWICGVDASENHLSVRLEGNATANAKMPGLPDDVDEVRAICQDAGSPRINFIAYDGRTFTSDYDITNKTRLAAVQRTSVPDSTKVLYAIHDPDQGKKVYACDFDMGLYLSPDGMVRWIKVREVETGVGHRTYQVSTGAPSWAKQ